MYESYGTYDNDEYVDNHGYDDDTDDGNDHKKDSYTAAGAAPTQTWPDSEYYFFLFGKQNTYNNNNIGRFPGGGLENQNPARTIAHSPPGVKETLNYMLRGKKNMCKSKKKRFFVGVKDCF